MKKYKTFFLLNLILVSLLSCSGVKEGFTSGKKENSDEFLVQKKSPLIMPPNYNELPTPIENNFKNNNKNEIKKLIGEKKEASINTNNSTNVDQTLENSVLDKIKSN